MTVVATMLAGLASSEMTRAQYDRSLAAQLQSKAGDQWSFFQAKKLRSAMQHTTLDTIAATGAVGRFDASAFKPETAAGTRSDGVEPADTSAALAVLAGDKLPEPAASPALDPKVAAALEALEKSRPDAELTERVNDVDNTVLATTLRAARERALAQDLLTAPLSRAVDAMEARLKSADPVPSAAAQPASPAREFTVARLNYNARRYDLEARHNQAIASLYELQVRKNNISAERHHKRSGNFFYGMLAAQMAVIIATFAIAARKRNVLWTIAAVAGTAAIAFAVYVYLYV